MLKGICHVALKCADQENFKETVDFYEKTLGLKKVKSWGEGADAGVMLEINGGIVEIFASGRVSDQTGAINHFAFLTDDADECVRRVEAAGYKVVSPASNLDFPLNEPAGKMYALRVAFCLEPVGETIEFFSERKE